MKSKETEAKIWLEYKRIHGKKGLLTAPQSDVFFVRIMGRVISPVRQSIVLREFVYEDHTKAVAQYDLLRDMLQLKSEKKRVTA